MCFSLEASALSFAWCTAVAMYIARRRASVRDEWTSAFLAAYGLVQLCDALLWLDAESMPAFARNRPRSALCTSTNDLVTGVGLPVVLTNVAFTQIEHGLGAVLGRYNKNCPRGRATLKRPLWCRRRGVSTGIGARRRTARRCWARAPWCGPTLKRRARGCSLARCLFRCRF